MTASTTTSTPASQSPPNSPDTRPPVGGRHAQAARWSLFNRRNWSTFRPALTPVAFLDPRPDISDADARIQANAAAHPGARIRSASRLGANWVPELRRTATKPETDASPAEAPICPMCRDKAAGPHDQSLLAMQKVEGSSPFSRFREVPGSKPFLQPRSLRWQPVAARRASRVPPRNGPTEVGPFRASSGDSRTHHESRGSN
jgi:hypothetical protein